MQRSTDNLFLTIAGITIEIHFGKSDWNFKKESIINSIIHFYRPFIKDHKGKDAAAFTVVFIDKLMPTIITRTTDFTHYIQFYKLEKKKITTHYDIGFFQFQYIVTFIVQYVLSKNMGFVLHSSAIDIGGKASLFLGHSGAGKSSIINLLKDRYGVLADDTSIIVKESETYSFFQTPLVEKEGWIKKGTQKYPLDRLYFLKKSDRFFAEKIKDKDFLLKKLMEQILLNWVPEKNIKKKMRCVMKFIAHFDEIYELSFTKNKRDAVSFFESLSQ